MGKSYPVKLIACTFDPHARIKAVELDNLDDFNNYDSHLYHLYEISGTSVMRRNKEPKKLRPKSKEYKEVMRMASNF